MAEFKKQSFGGPRRPFNKGGAGRSFGSRNDGPRELFDAECNSCHKRCQVPFRPNGKKPVYCADCFSQNDDRSQTPRFGKREFNAPRSHGSSAPRAEKDPRIDDLKRQLDTMNATLEKLVAAIESSNRATALTKEVRKHVPAAKPAPAPRKAAAKKPVKKVAKKAKKA